MKKVRFILSAMIIAIGFTSFAQVSVGIKGIVNFSDAQVQSFIDNVNEAPHSKTSGGFGIIVEVPLTPYLSFQPEIQYIRKGFVIDQGTTFGAMGADIPIGTKIYTNLDYLEAPILFKGSVRKGSVDVYAIAGASVGYAIQGAIRPKVNVLIDFNLPEITLDLNNTIYNRTDVAGIIGGGVALPTFGGKLFADLRYQHSFSNSVQNTIADIKVKNKGIQLSMGYAHRF